MILKSLKRKSNQKFVEQVLLTRQVVSTNKRIETVGVLLNYSEFCDYNRINAFLDTLGVSNSKRNFLIFKDPKEAQKLHEENVFTKNDFGWKGRLKKQELIDFTNTEYDVLICYFLENSLELIQIAATSKAKFKVGVSCNSDRVYDLIINDDSNNFQVFANELKKYLTILKKL